MANKMKVNQIGLTLLALLMLSACGQKRALYLPEEPTSNNTIPDSEPTKESVEQGND
jgi:predicted small lipoprotein YifL